MTGPVIEIVGVSKQYGGLRPLRLDGLSIEAGAQVALVGFDQPAAEVFINLVTGATLPDEGEVRVLGRGTSSIADSADWLSTLDRFGIVSERAALLEQLSPIQNLAMPFTLAIEPPAPEFRARAEALALETGLDRAAWDQPVAALAPAARLRLRLGRALALEPAVVLLEHPSAVLPREHVAAFGRDLRAIAARRGAALVSVTADELFACSAAERVLVLQPATGRFTERRRGLLSRLF